MKNPDVPAVAAPTVLCNGSGGEAVVCLTEVTASEGIAFDVIAFEAEFSVVLLVSKGSEGSGHSPFVGMVASLDLDSKKFPLFHVYTDTISFCIAL